MCRRIVGLIDMSRYAPGQPFNQLPPLPPAGFDPNTSLTVLRALIPARSSLAELAGLTASLPNPDLFLDLVALREGQASSAIENLVTTQDELYRAIAEGVLFAEEAPAHRTEGTTVKEVLRYREAMYEGYRLLRERPIINTTMCTRIVQQIKGRGIGVRTGPGTHIGRKDGTIVYTPPVGEDTLRGKLRDWERYLNEGNETLEHDPLVAMAVAHYQFEAIHPFPDGNGRTGRIVNVLHLVRAGLLPSPILYLSGYINAHRTAYYRGLRAVTESGAWESWVIYMLEAVTATSRETARDIRAILELMTASLVEIREALGDRVPAERIRDLAFRNAYLKIGTLEREGIAKRETASKYLHALTKDDGGPDLLRAERRGRDVYFRNHRLLDVLSSGE